MRIRRLTGFTLVEVLIAIAVIGLLAASGTVSYQRSQQASRDSRRKQDVTTYSQAVAAYLAAHGNAAIQDSKAGACNLADTTAVDPEDPSKAASGSGCAGASGRGYGLVNAATGTATGITGSGISSANRSYASVSISAALHDLGYLATPATDPRTKDASDASGGNADYILLRCCNDGRQNVSDGGIAYAVWTHLEGAINSNDTSNTANACGGSSAAGKAAAASGISGYAYDFASGSVGTSANYAAGAAVGSTSYVGSCKTQAGA